MDLIYWYMITENFQKAEALSLGMGSASLGMGECLTLHKHFPPHVGLHAESLLIKEYDGYPPQNRAVISRL